MKMVQKHFVTLTGALVVAASVAACGPAGSRTCKCETQAVTMPASTGEPVVFAVEGHEDAPQAVLTAAMRSQIENAADTNAAVGIVSVDGNPQLVKAGRYEANAGNPAANAANRRDFVSGVNDFVAAVRAAAPHVDDVAALRVAAAAVRSSRLTGGVVVLEDSGLSDTGYLNFAKTDLLQAAPGEVVAFLQHNHALPDLVGIRVVLVGIGDTTPPQAPLDQSSRDNLIAIYKAVVLAAGAKSVTVDTTPVQLDPEAAPRKGLPEVVSTKVPAQATFQAIGKLGISGEPTSTVVTLPDSGPIGFLADQAVLRDPRRASSQLDELAKELRKLPNAQITILGTTSSAGALDAAGDRDRATLSMQRAGVIRTALIRRHVPAGWFAPVRGNGYHFRGYVTDRATDGSLLPGAAAANRSVRLTVTVTGSG